MITFDFCFMVASRMAVRERLSKECEEAGRDNKSLASQVLMANI